MLSYGPNGSLLVRLMLVLVTGLRVNNYFKIAYTHGRPNATKLNNENTYKRDHTIGLHIFNIGFNDIHFTLAQAACSFTRIHTHLTPHSTQHSRNGWEQTHITIHDAISSFLSIFLFPFFARLFSFASLIGIVYFGLLCLSYVPFRNSVFSLPLFVGCEWRSVWRLCIHVRFVKDRAR